MSYRRTRNKAPSAASEVMGPNSAMTAFLREHGIDNETITRLGNRFSNEIAEDDTSNAEASDSLVSERTTREQTEQPQDEEEDGEIALIRQAAREKRRANRGNDLSDDEYVDSFDKPVPQIGSVEFCDECDKRFTVSSRSFRRTNDVTGEVTYLCDVCSGKQKAKEQRIRSNELAARKRRKKVAQALLDREEYKLPKLQDICIKVVSKHITDVEMLGDIGSNNMAKLSKILSRYRSLDDNSMKLFLNQSVKVLEFWDCSKLTSRSLSLLPAYCSSIQTLNLNMCGQLDGKTLQYFATNLQQLTKVFFNGPFLISPKQWNEFILVIGPRLKGFHLQNTHRFNDDNLMSLLSNAPNLEELTLSRVDGIMKRESFQAIANSFHQPHQLKHLELSYPSQEDLIVDETVISILKTQGRNLRLLNLDGCLDLTDETVTYGIKPFGVKLQTLSLKLVDQITTEAVKDMLDTWKTNVDAGDSNPGLMSVNLCRALSVGDDAVISLIEHSGHSLVDLNLNSMSLLTKKAFMFLSGFPQSEIDRYAVGQKLKIPVTGYSSRCHLLTHLDVGFVRCIDDEAIEMIGYSCAKLNLLEVYGNNMCTNQARIRPGLKVIGRQSDSI